MPAALLILNGRMPGMHGIEFFERFRQFSKAPVIIYSASADDIEIELARHGTPADSYFGKPASTGAMIAEVRRLLAQKCRLG